MEKEHTENVQMRPQPSAGGAIILALSGCARRFIIYSNSESEMSEVGAVRTSAL